MVYWEAFGYGEKLCRTSYSSHWLRLILTFQSWWGQDCESYITAVYGHSSLNIRQSMWGKLINLDAYMHKPWVTLGDFKDVGPMEEKQGGARCDPVACLRFRDSLRHLWIAGLRKCLSLLAITKSLNVLIELSATHVGGLSSRMLQCACLKHVKFDHLPLFARFCTIRGSKGLTILFNSRPLGKPTRSSLKCRKMGGRWM